MKNKFQYPQKKYFLFFFIIFALFNCEKDDTPSENLFNESISISATGGEYTLSNGIILNIPAGAVLEETEIEIAEVNVSDLTFLLEDRGMTSRNLIACLDFKPDGLEFEEPIKVTIPVDLEAGDIPFIHDLDIENGSYEPAVTEVKVDPEAGTIEILVHHFSGVAAEIKAELKRASQYCEDFPCRCQGFTTRQSDKSIICELEECQNTQSELFVNYTKCGGYTEVYIIQELSKECIPKLILSASKTTIAPGESCEITAKVKHACGYQGEQTIDFSVASLGQVNPPSGVTEVGGGTTITFIAGDEEGTATITAATVMKYVMYNVYAAGGSLIEAPDAPIITKGLTETIDIEIDASVQVWSGTMTYDYRLDFYFNGEELARVSQASYDVVFNFTARETTDNRFTYVIEGIGTATQSDVSVVSYHSLWRVQNLDAPSTLDLILYGHADNDNYLHISMKEDDNTDFFTYEYCHTETNDCYETSEVSLLSINHDSSDTDKIPFTEGTHTGTFTEYGITRTYTITLSKN